MEIHKNSLIQLTKQLRTRQTPWESKLWYYLRGNRLDGLKFKRQVMIGEYIVDFCCNERKLVIELDGGHHNDQKSLLHDDGRTAYIEKYGYLVLRFWNNEIDKNMNGVLLIIKQALEKNGSTSPSPSPGLERG